MAETPVAGTHRTRRSTAVKTTSERWVSSYLRVPDTQQHRSLCHTLLHSLIQPHARRGQAARIQDLPAPSIGHAAYDMLVVGITAPIKIPHRPGFSAANFSAQGGKYINYKLLFLLAEGVGFEPTDGCPSLVFKTSAFNHSATLPTTVFKTAAFGRSASFRRSGHGRAGPATRAGG